MIFIFGYLSGIVITAFILGVFNDPIEKEGLGDIIPGLTLAWPITLLIAIPLGAFVMGSWVRNKFNNRRKK